MIIQKFGGIAVRDSAARKHCIRHIIRGIQEHGRVIAVVSAMGRAGDPHSTDSLLCVSSALKETPHASDVAAACGELLSSAVLSAELAAAGIRNELLYGTRSGITSEGPFGAAGLRADPHRLLASLGDASVGVVPGFLGMGADGLIRTTGRGGSDLTAVVLAKALDADAAEFFKDVPGIMTADPGQDPDAEMIGSMSYSELVPLLSVRRPVIQKKAALYAARAQVPLHIRSYSGCDQGTWILP
ncbi:amino acid kinase family protein [Edaphobacillus lindanitolerans]|uniref:aspartate kinase n=1 Tax=Edaphobacillus lindanitolerans TaxID=550447 RepID=A0A1U7PLP0_9BACI|nr:aspartate kinase [Edaphobacillus lindanitolerans]SIT68018.1 aspartate kinase [Edaphobacillus lindanitolerans]